MKIFSKLLLLTFFFCVSINLYSQFPSNKVFVNVSNIRAGHSLSSKIVGQMRQFEDVKLLYNEDAFEDTINGKINRWLPILYKNSKAYIWGNNLATQVLTDLNDLNDNILFKYIDSNTVSLKVFRDSNLIYKRNIEASTSGNNSLSINAFGKTYFTDSHLFSIETRNFDNYKIVNYELYEWNGKEIIKSEVELIDDSKITGKYIDFPYSIVNNDMAALRETADTNATIVYQLPINTKVKVIEAHVNNKTLWHKVEWNNKEYYISYKDLCLSIRYIKSNKHKGISFLYANNAVFAFKDEVIIDKLKIPVWWRREELYEISSLGIDLGLDFLGVKVRCYTEGCEFGQDIYSWDGTNLKYFCSDLNSGDFGYYGGHNFEFPIENNELKKNEVLFIDFDITYYDSPFNSGTLDFKIREKMKKMEYQGDSLAEIPSKYLELAELISENFPHYFLHHASYFDLDNNGYDDAVAYIAKTSHWNETTDNPKILIAFTNQSGKFNEFQVIDSMFSTKTLAVNFMYSNDILSLNILEPYKSESKEGFYDNYRIEFNKIFDKYLNDKPRKLKHYDFRFNSEKEPIFILTNHYIGLGNDWNYFWISKGFDPVPHSYIIKEEAPDLNYDVNIKSFEDKFRVWVMDVYYYPFYNDSLKEGLIFQTTKSGFTLEIFYFKTDSIPEDFLNDLEFISLYDSKVVLNKMKHMEGKTYSMKQSDGITADPDKKYTSAANPFEARHFFNSEEIRLGMSVDELVDMYGAAYVQEISDNLYKFQWVSEDKFRLIAYTTNKRVSSLKIKYYSE